ncbi:MAG: hypothetical protein INR73_00540 [Williamsia sp.]|nr:hypothetical protein [Williamsia sp.]
MPAIQERLYNKYTKDDLLADEQSNACLSILTANGETDLSSGLLVARYGKGYYVYTTLPWFRQLPAGVTSAYRLFANMIAWGKNGGLHIPVISTRASVK